MIGTAYPTPIRAKVFNTIDDLSAVYAVWPPLVFERFEKTTHLLVTSSQLVGDTQVYPCDEHGEPMSYVMVEHVTVRNHILALCLAGYELEVLARGA